MKGSKLSRVQALEAKAAKWKAEHLPASDLPRFLFAVLDVVGQEAGPDALERIAGRIVEDRAARVHGLLSTLTAAQLEDVARRAGFPVPDVSGMSAPELARFYFAGGGA